MISNDGCRRTPPAQLRLIQPDPSLTDGMNFLGVEAVRTISIEPASRRPWVNCGPKYLKAVAWLIDYRDLLLERNRYPASPRTGCTCRI